MQPHVRNLRLVNFLGQLVNHARAHIHRVNSAAFAHAPVNTYGNAGRYSLQGPGAFTFDFALMRRILQRDHDVVATTRPAEAVARLAGGERFDVILCDLMMPDLSGVEVHRRVSRDAPEMAGRMVFITAGAFSEPAHAFLRDGGVDWVEKPIDPDDLRALVAARVARG
jgi:CheY-like chemotaxis protein